MGIPNASVRVDLWRSMNKRYQQRFVDPTVDLFHAPWKWSKTTPWILPCLFDYDDQRTLMDETAENYAKEGLEVVFVADFPGMSLEHYLNETETKFTTLMLLDGNIEVEFQGGERYVVPRDQNVSLPLGETHVVHTVGKRPSRYMYSYDSRSLEEEKESEEIRLLDDWGKVLRDWSKKDERRAKTLQMLKDKNLEMSKRSSPIMQLVDWWKITTESALQTWLVVSTTFHEIFLDKKGGGMDLMWREKLKVEL
jgi:hypothetical protein